jgi:hypothetical protein
MVTKNDYAYALMIKRWRDSKQRWWFAGYAVRSNEQYHGEGAASFGEVLETFEPQLQEYVSFAQWYRGRQNLVDDVWVDTNVWRVKRKRDLVP